MNNFFKKHIQKEKEAARKWWGVYLKLLIVFWGLIGVYMLFSSAWLLGLIFVLAAVYIGYRIMQKSKNNKDLEKKEINTENK